MNDEIKNIIEQHIPLQVGAVLKELLAKGEKAISQVESLEKLVSELRKEISAKNERLVEYAKFDSRNETLENKSIELADRERNLRITILENKLADEVAKSEFAKSIGLGLVRNIEFRKNVFDSENQSAYQNTNGEWIYPTPVNKNLNETKSAE